MSSNSFKIKQGLTLNPTDPATITNAENGDIICDSTDQFLIKQYDSALSAWRAIGPRGLLYDAVNNEVDASIPISADKPFKLASANSTITGTSADLAGVSAPIIRFTSATLSSLGTISSPAAGQEAILINATGNPISIVNESAGTAANRILTGTGADLTLQNNASIRVVYDSVSSRWRVVGGSGSGTGAGGINYITNSDFEGGITGYATYADAAGVAPVDGTGGTANTTFAVTSSSPLRGTKSGLLTKNSGASRQGEGVSYAFSIDTADQAQVLRISFDYETSDNYADGNIRVYVYDVTNSQLIEVVDRDLPASGRGKYVGTFQSSANSTSYRLIFHIAETGTLAYTFELDNVVVGPQTLIKGPIVTDWQNYTPVYTASTTAPTIGTATNTGRWRRVGDTMQVRLHFSQTVAGTAGSGTYFISLPVGTQVDTNKINSISFPACHGYANVSIGSASILQASPLVTASGSEYIIRLTLDDSVSAGTTWNHASTYNFGNANLRFHVYVEVPILGWSSNVVLSEDAGNREIICKANRITSSQTVTGAGLEVIFNNEVTDTSSSYEPTTGRFTAPESGWYDVSYSLEITSGSTPSSLQAFVFINGLSTTGYGAYLNSDIIAAKKYPVQGSETIYLSKGQYISVWAFSVTVNSTLDASTANRSFLSVAKRSSPQTIAASEVVAASYSSNSGQSISGTITVLYEDKTYDTHNAYNTSTGVYTVPVSGKYLITAQIGVGNLALADNNVIDVRIMLNGTRVGLAVHEFSQTDNFTQTVTTTRGLDLVKGDLISFQGTVATGNLNDDGGYNNFTITRIK